MQASEYLQSRTSFGGGILYVPKLGGLGADIKYLQSKYSDTKGLKGLSSEMFQIGLLYGFK